MSFWPDDIFAEDTISPRDIMKRAGEELSTRTKVLSVSIRENRLADRVVLGLVVKNDTYALEVNLVEASHRLNQTYPVVIDPPASDIPEFLTREHFIPGRPGIATTAMHMTILGGTPDRTVKNEWVCATPQEFTKKLKAVLAFDHVKSIILSLLAPAQVLEPAESQSVSEEPHSSGDEHENGVEPTGEA